VAGALSQRLEEVGLQEEDEERQHLEAFLGHLQVCAGLFVALLLLSLLL
jgi:hypothetical protein